MLIASSVRPAPISPAMPTTSPARTSKLAPSTTMRPVWVGWCTVQSSTRSTSSPICGVRSGYRCSRSRPTMPLMIRSWVEAGSRMSSVSIVRPSRMIVVRSAMSRDLVELVRDHDRGDALLLELAQQAQQVLGVAVVERRRRLVEDEQLDLLRERLGDLDELLLADAELADGRHRVLVAARPAPGASRPRVGPVPVDQAAAPAPLVAEEDVLGDRQVGHQRELLVDDDDALGLGVVDRVEPARARPRRGCRRRRCRTGRPPTAPSSGSTCRRRSRRRSRGSRRARPSSVTSCSALTPGERLGDATHLQDVVCSCGSPRLSWAAGGRAPAREHAPGPVPRLDRPGAGGSAVSPWRRRTRPRPRSSSPSRRAATGCCPCRRCPTRAGTTGRPSRRCRTSRCRSPRAPRPPGTPRRP